MDSLEQEYWSISSTISHYANLAKLYIRGILWSDSSQPLLFWPSLLFRSTMDKERENDEKIKIKMAMITTTTNHNNSDDDDDNNNNNINIRRTTTTTTIIISSKYAQIHLTEWSH